MSGTSLDVVGSATLHSPKVAVTHQGDFLPIHSYDAVDHIAAPVDPGEHYITPFREAGLFEDYAVASACNEGNHTVAAHREGNARVTVDKPFNFVYNFVVSHHGLLLWLICIPWRSRGRGDIQVATQARSMQVCFQWRGVRLLSVVPNGCR